MDFKKRSPLKTIQRTKKFIIAAFLLSLLFHTSSIIYVVWQGANNNSTQSLQEKEEILKQNVQKQDEWAEAKARAGNFGAPVMFQDEPSYADPSETTQEQPEDKHDKVNPDSIQKPEQKIIEEIIPEKVIPKDKHVSLQEPVEEVRPKATKSKQAPQQQPSPMQARKSARPPQQKKMTAPKPPLSLAQLTQGFLNHVKDEGKHAIHMLGKKTGVPSDEQIKYERYLQKLSWCLQNSFNINNDRFPPSATTDSTVYIMLALNKDGTMRNCNVAKTSGNSQLDQFTLFIFNDASTSFPPVPTYLPHDPFTITYVISHNTTEQNNVRMYRR